VMKLMLRLHQYECCTAIVASELRGWEHKRHGLDEIQEPQRWQPPLTMHLPAGFSN
jgi:hypothetical protein